MKKDFELLHMEEIIRNLNNELEKIEGRSLQGMILAAIHIQRDMIQTAPKIPIDYGNLQHSYFTISNKGGGDQMPGKKPEGDMLSEHQSTVSTVESVIRAERMPVVAMGFSANYAVFVHENLDANFARPKKVGGKLKNRRPGAGARFFSSALDRNHKEILRIIGQNAQIK